LKDLEADFRYMFPSASPWCKTLKWGDVTHNNVWVLPIDMRSFNDSLGVFTASLLHPDNWMMIPPVEDG
jgi:hypothetical protein